MVFTVVCSKGTYLFHSHKKPKKMDDIVDLTTDDDHDGTARTQKIEIHGNPSCLPRARTSWKSKQRHYNPATKALQSFKNTIKSILPQTQLGYIYPKGVSITLTLIFYMRRPNSDFINKERGIDRLRQMLPLTQPKVPDVDNLVKFALDGMNQLIYEDDRQVVKLTAYKLFDNNGCCEGRTTIIISVFDNKDVPLLS